MGKEWDKFKDTGSSKYFHSPDTETEHGFGGRDMGTPIKALPRFAIDSKVYQDWCYDWAVEVLRVLKHGGHLLAFGGDRTVHRMTSAIEDAGFEVRGMLAHIFGSGFPKGLDISKAIDKMKGVKRKVIGIDERFYKKKRAEIEKGHDNRGVLPIPWGHKSIESCADITAPASPEARQWQGWNTQLKPAFQPIVFARKPISEKSVAENVLKHGTGAINEGACRIAVNPEVDAIGKATKRKTREDAAVFDEDSCGYDNPSNTIAGVLPSGRYPANLILSHQIECKMIQEGKVDVKDVSTHAPSQKMGKHGIYGHYDVPINMRHSFDVEKPEIWDCVGGCPIRILSEQSGGVGGGKATRGIRESTKNWRFQGSSEVIGHNDIGGAARFFFNCQMDWEREIVPFFYCPKPSVKERNAGLDQIYTFKPRNLHITVKSVALMRHLVKLVTRKGGLVLDPFMGSGTTAIAAENEGMNWLGCDVDSEYCQIARARIKALGGALE